ncbi:cation:proton antiporter [Alteromonas sediminis]|uniref:Cation:proton antiporter n=2 Tax=Alteromonas sediminis TaxID=2259342 RepID=A0A3N5XXI1_9ALTE|nr:cation:proton antiporter [Alteromonas sediminis]
MDISNQSAIFIAIGALLLISLAVNAVGQRTALPRVTLLLLLGVAAGSEGLNLLPEGLTNSFELVTDIALLMVGFLLGGKLVFAQFRNSGSQVLWISLMGALVTAILVYLGAALIGVSYDVALLLGAIASATAPAAIYDVIDESKLQSNYANTLLAVVAIDDAWALLLFGVCIAIASAINGHAIADSLAFVAWDIGGAVLLGLAIGLPASYLTGRMKPGQPMLIEAMGCVLLCGGLAQAFHVSYLISAIVMGVCIANFARHHDYPFHEIENIEWPFMVLFFVLAGASIDLSAIVTIGLLGLVYTVTRCLGKWLGAFIGGTLSGAPAMTRNWMGLAMLPQAGVGIGLALAAAQYFPDHRQVLLSVVVSTTVFFELAGPVLTRLTLQQAMRH